MAATKEAIVICLDVGPHMRVRDDEGSPTALEQAVECINWILQRKIFTESKDEFALVLFGTNETENPLANDDTGEYSNICVVRELQPPDWDFVKYIQNEIPPPDPPLPADFLDAIIVSLDLISTSTAGKKYAGKQLVLFSNLGSPFADDQADKVAEAIKNGGIDFTLFGPHLHLNGDDDGGDNEDRKQNGAGVLKKTEQQELGEQFMTRILDKVGGQSFSLRQGLSLLSRFTTRVIRPVPWKCNFELGEVKIPICMYVKTKKAKLKQSWKWTHAQDPNADIAMQRTYHKKDEDEDEEEAETQAATQGTATKPKYPDRDVDDEEDEATEAAVRAPMGKELEKEDVIKAYKYGNTIVPLDKLDLETMKYRNTEKCLKLLSFIESAQARRQYFLGDGCHVVFPEGKDEEATTAFTALWKAMKEEHRVALVRYAYSARSSPRVGVLIPSTEGEGAEQLECFVFVTFPFEEDCRAYAFPPLGDEQLEPSAKQLQIIDDLITCMDLTHAKVDESGHRHEAYKPSEVVDPSLQNTCASLAHRALHPNRPLPPVNKQWLASISPMDERLHLARPVFDEMRHTFHLKKKEIRKDKRTGQDVYQAGETGAGGPSAKVPRTDQRGADNAPALKISSVRPAEEFAEYVNKDESLFQEASEQLETIIFQFIFDAVGSQFYEKAMDCIDVYRRESIQVSKPRTFNGFLRQLKRRSIDGGKRDFLAKLEKEHLGLISERECAASDVDSFEAKDFFGEEDTKPIEKGTPAASEEPNLLDELE